MSKLQVGICKGEIMTIQFLKYIVAVAEIGSITEAAKQLHISQPSLSAALKEAEKEVGFKVFTRSRSGIALTKEGVEFLGYARQVIQEMNRQGIMVDLSHAAESSFYDALSISTTPIVCSHSCCKALCDVPRNLSDEQLKALAQRGGVAQITLYPGFLRKGAGEADIMDVMAHLEHAIQVMGIEHVGLGTDFDGDGGVRGLASSSEMLNFTLQLLRRKYSERDIARIWGGNWLRVMAQVQMCKQEK